MEEAKSRLEAELVVMEPLGDAVGDTFCPWGEPCEPRSLGFVEAEELAPLLETRGGQAYGFCQIATFRSICRHASFSLFARLVTALRVQVLEYSGCESISCCQLRLSDRAPIRW